MAIFAASSSASDYSSDGAFSETRTDPDPAPSRSARTPSFHSMSDQGRMEEVPLLIPEAAEPPPTLEQRLAATETALAEILGLLRRPQPNQPAPPPVSTPPAPAYASAAAPQIRPRLAEPPRFNGSHSEGRSFIDALQLYYLSAGFTTDHQAIVWALGYFDSGRAEQLRREFLEGSRQWPTWAAFSSELREEFYPIDEVARNVVLLETTGYYQRSRSMDEYIDSFKQICRDAGHTLDGSRSELSAILVAKFRRGMNAEVMTQIARSGSFRPADNDLLGWFDSARRLARADAENRAFLNASRAPPTPLNRVYAPVPNRSVPYAPPAGPPPLPTYRAPSPALPMGEPMDIGRARRRDAPGFGRPGSHNKCYTCGKVGHFSRECPDKPEYHVRALTHEDVEEIMQDYAARRDSAALADAAPSEAPSAPSEAELEAAQGFPSGRE